MSKTFTFDRFDIYPTKSGNGTVREESTDGILVLAEDAINREAVNVDRIRVLEVQLKEEKERALRLGLRALRAIEVLQGD